MLDSPLDHVNNVLYGLCNKSIAVIWAERSILDNSMVKEIVGVEQNKLTIDVDHLCQFL